MFMLKVLLSPVLFFVYWPGKIILWVDYMFPDIGQGRASKRRYESPIMNVIVSIAFWASILILTQAMAANNSIFAQRLISLLSTLDSDGYARSAIINLDMFVKGFVS